MEKYKDSDAFDSSYKFYKGNLHSHTTVSDGKLKPEESAKLYKEAGYSFLAITDHNIFTDFSSDLDDEKFIIIPGFEASVLWFYNKTNVLVDRCHHLLVFKDPDAKDFDFKHLENVEILKLYGPDVDFVKESQKFIDNLKKRGAVICYNHPAWSRVMDSDFLSLKGYDFLEIYNWGTVLDSNSGSDVTSWQKVLDSGCKVNALATDDNHNKATGELFDSFGGYVMVNAKDLNQDEIMKALLAGQYYSSSGAVIKNWGIRNGKAYLECENANFVFFRFGPGVRCAKVKCEKGLTYAEFDIPEDTTYFRFEVVDDKGKTAWTNPYYIDDNFLL